MRSLAVTKSSVEGTFPFFLLFIEIDPHSVDVNVHPSKMEAKLPTNIRCTIWQARWCDTHSRIRKQSCADPNGDREFVRSRFELRFATASLGRSTKRLANRRRRCSIGFARCLSKKTDGAGLVSRLPGDQKEVPAPDLEPQALHHESDRPESSTSGLIWQLHNKYILCQIRSGVMIVDQHVAHERVLYERILERFKSGIQAAQQLLFPITLQLQSVTTPFEYPPATFPGNGSTFSLFGKNAAIVEGVPRI